MYGDVFMRPFIILVLVLLLIALLPTWSWSQDASMGFWPSVILGLLVALVVAAMFVKPGSQD